jgi:hypothetical protein
MTFYPGLHHPSDAKHFPRCMISVNTIRERKSGFVVNDWMLDSGAFTELAKYGKYRHNPAIYAKQVIRWSANGDLLAAVTQDYMCEPFMLEKTGLTIEAHQRYTIKRYDSIRKAVPFSTHILPVLQGYDPDDYVEHVRQYGDRLHPGMWVGVGSVCKRNGDPKSIVAVLSAIKKERPDLRLHGFGIKLTALGNAYIRDALHSSDSMAWSFAAWKQGRNPNDWHEAQAYCTRVEERLAA